MAWEIVPLAPNQTLWHGKFLQNVGSRGPSPRLSDRSAACEEFVVWGPWRGWGRSGRGASLVFCFREGLSPGQQGDSTQLSSFNPWGPEVTLSCKFQLAAELDPRFFTTRLSWSHQSTAGLWKPLPPGPFSLILILRKKSYLPTLPKMGHGTVGAWALRFLPTLPLFLKQRPVGKTFPPFCEDQSAYAGPCGRATSAWRPSAVFPAPTIFLF